jgi:hypothetical protein
MGLGKGWTKRSFALLPVMVGVALLAGCVGNPGAFTIAMHEGSNLSIEDEDGLTTFVLDIASVACDDGVDNDLDGTVDSGADAECDSAVDANERLDGVQVYSPPVQPVDIDAAGAMTYDPTEMVVPQREQCIDLGSVWCLGLRITGVGPSRSGSVESSAVLFPTTIKIEIDALVGFAGLPANCEIGPIDGTWVADNYDLVTGATHMVATDSEIPATTGCGDWAAALDSFLGLPTLGDAVLESTILNGSGQPVQLN